MMFSIVVSDCDSVVSPEVRQRFFDSLNAQTSKDFEVVMVHDGPRTQKVDLKCGDYRLVTAETSERAKLGGDNLRPIGMQIAQGEYFINTNIDNVYYPSCIKELKDFILKNKFKVVISSVVMKGMNYKDGRIWYDNPRDYTKSHLLTGKPVTPGNIDIMNLIAHRDVFEDIGYWMPHSSTSDGQTYEKICQKYPFKYSNIIIGEHY